MKKGFLFTAIATFLILAVGCLFLSIPYLGDRVIPPLIEKLPFDSKTVTIHRANLWETVGQFELGGKNSSISCASFTFRYQPRQLFQKKISSLLLDNVTIILGSKIFSPGKQDQAEEFNPKQLLDNLSGAIDTIILKNTTIIFQNSAEKRKILKLDGQIHISTVPNKTKFKLNSIKAEIAISGLLEGKTKTIFLNNPENFSLKTTISDLNLSALEELGLTSSGLLDIKSTLVFDRQFKKLQTIETEFISDQFSISQANITANTQNGEQAQLLIKGSAQEFHYSFSGINLLAAGIDSSFSGKGLFNLKSLDTKSTLKIENSFLKTPLEIVLNKKGNHFSISSTAEGLQLPGFDNFKHSPIKLSVTGTLKEDQADTKVKIFTEEISLPAQQIALQEITVNQDFKIKGTKLEPASGNLNIGKIRFQGNNGASLAASSKLSSESLQLNSIIRSPYHDKLRINCNSNIYFSKANTLEMNCTLPPIVVTEKNIPPYVKLPEELMFNATMTAQLELLFRNQLQGKLKADISNTTMNFGDKFSLTNLNTRLTLPNLPLQYSAPSQTIDIEKINAGNIETMNAHITYRLEDFKTVLIERSSLNWCGGKVESGSIRIASNVHDYNLTLYCDRIGFTSLLTQLGMPNAEGKGTLNGRIPISFSDSILHFDDGFLFSSPGDSGIIRFTNTENIRSNLGENLATSYLDYSMKALENFAYNWATLSFNSRDDDLTVIMKLDGKPAAPLPFTYKNGQLAPSAQGSGVQHPIHMDVNFHLPLDALFHYGKNIQSLMGTM